MLGPIEKRLVLAVCLLAWLGLMIGQVVKYMSGRLTATPSLTSLPAFGAKVNRALQIESNFALASVIRIKPARNLDNPFYPNPSQPPPPPPPPSTRSVEALYQGFFLNSQGEKRAYITVEDTLYVKTVGAKLVADYVITDISMTSLTLKDGAGKAWVFPFNTKKPLTIPVQ